VARPAELLWSFRQGHHTIACELRDHGPHGVEAQFYKDEEFVMSRRFDESMDRPRPPRELAIAWAEQERVALEQRSSTI